MSFNKLYVKKEIYFFSTENTFLTVLWFLENRTSYFLEFYTSKKSKKEIEASEKLIIAVIM